MDGTTPRVVSLRVPGVEHSSAEPILDALSTEQVDEAVTRGQFWRWRPAPPTDYTAEAYLWGARSSPTTRALWLLLLPFTLVNIATWARPARRRGVVSWVADVSVGIVCRLIALSLTASLMLAAIGVVMDVFAWQCLGRGRDCTSSWAEPLDLIGENSLPDGQRLAIAALVPFALLWTLWLVSLRTWRRYERRADIQLRADRLTDARFWRGRSWVERLRATHVVTGMALVDGALVYPVLLSDVDSGRRSAPVGFALLVLAGGAVLAAIAGVVAPLPLAAPTVKTVRDGWAVAAMQRSARLSGGVRVHSWAADRVDLLVETARARARAVSTPVTRAMRLVGSATIVVTLGCLVYAILPRPRTTPPDGPLPGLAGAAATLSVVQAVLVIALTISVVPLSRIASRARRRVAFRGFVAPLIATVAILLAAGESAGTIYLAALLVGRLETVDSGRVWQPAPPYPYQWAGLVFVVAVGSGLVAAAVYWVRWRRLLRRGCAATDLRDPTLRINDPDTAEELDRAHARGRVLEKTQGLVLIVVLPTATLSLVGVVASAAGHGPGALLPAQSTPTTLGTWSIGLVALTLVFAGLRVGSTPKVRRFISAIWAMATFWPRAAHPFGAPAHGPRAVADLVLRINRLTDRDHCVLLAGHSHGALIATTVVLYLPEAALNRTALLTSASPVTRLIEPIFGGFFHREVLLEVADRLTDSTGVRWRNLYRITDPIGGPVLAGSSEIDTLVPDPDIAHLHDGSDGTPRGHGHYLHNRIFLAQHATFVARLAERASRR